jgi:hypothetical protein
VFAFSQILAGEYKYRVTPDTPATPQRTIVIPSSTRAVNLEIVAPDVPSVY